MQAHATTTERRPEHDGQMRSADGRTFRTEAELARYLGRSLATVRKWRAQRIGPPFTKPKGVKQPLYLIADTEAWLFKGRVEAR